MVVVCWKIFLCTVFVFFMLVPIVEAADGKWVFIGYTRYRDPLYADMSRMEVKPNGMIGIWTRITVAESSLFRGQLRRDLHRTGKSEKNVKYLDMKKEINCQGNRIRHLGLTYYDYRDRVLATTGNVKAPWKPILPGSLWPDLQKAVCGTNK